MITSPRPDRALLLAVLCAAARAAYIPTTNLFERDGTCISGFSQCTQAGLPDNFCCRTGDTCVPLAGNTTLLCCPQGDCLVVSPITCDLSLEDAKAHPDAAVKTTALNGNLGHCGDGTCCPFGYTCNSDSLCEKNANQNAVPIQSPSPSSSVGTATASASQGSATHTGTATASSSATPVSVSPIETTSSAASASPTDTGSTSSGTSTGVIVGGVIGGVAAAVLLGILACICLRHRRQKRQAQDRDPLKLNRSTSSFGNIIANPITTRGPISKPIASGNSTMRSDFTLKTTPQNSPGSRRDSGFGVGLGRHHSRDSATSFGDVSPETPTPSRGGAAPRIPPIRNLRGSSGSPGTTRSSRDREPSAVSIAVFADARTMVVPPTMPYMRDRESQLTTMSGMMKQAGLDGMERGEPFVPGSAQSSPARRR